MATCFVLAMVAVAAVLCMWLKACDQVDKLKTELLGLSRRWEATLEENMNLRGHRNAAPPAPKYTPELTEEDFFKELYEPGEDKLEA